MPEDPFHLPEDDDVGDLKLERKHTKELNHKEWITNISLSLDKKGEREYRNQS